MITRTPVSWDGSNLASGELHVAVQTKSQFLNDSVPVEVRDARYQLVGTIGNSRSFTLSPGLYQVSAVLENGRKYQRIISVDSGQRTELEFDASAFEDWASTREASFPQDAFERTDAFVRSQPEVESRAKPSTANTPIELHGARLVDVLPSGWRLAAEGPSRSIPYAVVTLAEIRREISLPIHPSPDAFCDLVLEDSPTGVTVRANISSDRTVASALEKMLLSRELTSLSSVTDSAADLLWRKYQDPTGATLGALILCKVGLLEKHRDWLVNLAENFPWIPDARVLLASYLLQDGGASANANRAFELALHASEHRLLFSKSFADLLDLWRRWPKEHLNSSAKYATDRENAMSKLADRSPFVDWNSLYLSYDLE